MCVIRFDHVHCPSSSPAFRLPPTNPPPFPNYSPCHFHHIYLDSTYGRNLDIYTWEKMFNLLLFESALFNIIVSSPGHFSARINSLFLSTEQISSECMCHFLTHLSGGGNLGWFHSSATVNSAIANTSMQGMLCFSSFRHMLRVLWLNYVVALLVFEDSPYWFP